MEMAQLKSVKFLNASENLAFTFEEEKHPPALITVLEKSPSVGIVSHTVDVSLKHIKIRLYANLLTLNFSFVLLFTAFQSLQNLQSSLHPGLGTPSLSAIYASIIVSNIFIAPFIIKRFGCKKTLVVSTLLYCLYIAANIKKDWYQYTSLPTAIILGIAGAPLWGSQSTYITKLGIKYSAINNEDSTAVIARFFGIFGLIFQSSQIWGNLIIMFILQKPFQELESNTSSTNINENTEFTTENTYLSNFSDLNTLTIFPNYTEYKTESWTNENQTISNATLILKAVCGIRFCPFESSVSKDSTSDEQIYLLVGIFLACGLISSLTILIFLSNVEKKQDIEEKIKFSPYLFLETLSQLKKDLRQKLVVPLTLFVGLEIGLLTGDYTLAFVTCSLNISKVGSIMICYGAFNAICSYGFGYLTKLTGRLPIFIFAFLSSLAIMTTLNFWTPNKEQEFVFYIIVGLWGMNDAVWQSQILALYGSFFSNNQEPAFANKGVWESLGYTIAFAYSEFLCMQIKVYIVISMLLLGFLCYILAELVNRKGMQTGKYI